MKFVLVSITFNEDDTDIWLIEDELDRMVSEGRISGYELSDVLEFELPPGDEDE